MAIYAADATDAEEEVEVLKFNLKKKKKRKWRLITRKKMISNS
jgi:hypothetical protein